MERERAAQIKARCATNYAKVRESSEPARQFLEEHGLLKPELLATHQIGYSDNALTAKIASKGRVREELVELGILTPDGQECFAGCLVCPLTDFDNNIVNLVGIRTDDDCSQVLLSDQTGIWNLAAAKTYSEILVTDSILDAMSLHVAGHANALAVPQPALLDHDQLAQMASYGVTGVVVLGYNAELVQVFSTCFRCSHVDLPNANAYLLKHGPEALAAFLTEKEDVAPTNTTTIANFQALSTDSFLLTLGTRRYTVMGLQKNNRALKATIKVEAGGKFHYDTLDLYAARARRNLCQDMARVFETPFDTIESDLAKLVEAGEAYIQDDRRDVPPQDPLESMSDKDREEAKAFGRTADLICQIQEDYEKAGLVGERDNALLYYLAGTSRKMPKPLSILAQSSAGAGKSSLQDTTLHLFPEEDVVKVSALTRRSLFYKTNLSLKHKILALEEGAGADQASYGIRTLISAHELSIESAVRDPATGKMITMSNRVEGPTAIFLTSTDPNVDPEMQSRLITIGIDESTAQTHAILSAQRQQHTLEGLAHTEELDAILRRHRNFQRLLRPLAVVNPYAAKMTYNDARLQARRDQPKLLCVIAGVAFLNQMKKPVKTWTGNGKTVEYIEVDMDDIRIARRLADRIFGRNLDDLSVPARNLLMLIKQMVQKQIDEFEDDILPTQVTWSRRELREEIGWSNWRLHTYLNELLDLELVLVQSGRRNSGFRYCLACDTTPKDVAVLSLAGLEEAKRSA